MQTMFEYKGTERFDIGSGRGKYEYDFFMINDGNSFATLINHYCILFGRFEYLLDDYSKVENNTRLSPVVQAKMKEHNANLCLAFLKEEFYGNNTNIKRMVLNDQRPDGMYDTYFFNFYRFNKVRVQDVLEHGSAYAKSGLHNAAIKYFSHAIKLAPGFKIAYIHRGFSYIEIKDYGNAIEDFTQAVNLNLEKSFTCRGVAYMEAGDFDRAKADFAKALELDPDDEMAKEYYEELS